MKTDVRVGVVTGNGFETEYFSFGEGETPAVIIPGLNLGRMTSSAGAVAKGYEKFAEQFTVYLIDRRRDPPPSYTVEEMAADTAEAMDRLSIRDACVFGASQGGMIAMEIASRRPELVKKLALASTAMKVTADVFSPIEKWINLSKKGDGRALCLDFGERIYPPETFGRMRAALGAFGDAATREDLEKFAVIAGGARDFDGSRDAALIKCPVLVGADREDLIFGDEALRVAEYFPGGAELFVTRGCCHAMYDTSPAFRERLLRFFTEQSGGL